MRVIDNKNSSSKVKPSASENKLELLNNPDEYDYYQIARSFRIIFARFIDIIFASIIPLIITLTMPQWDQTKSFWAPIIVIGGTFIIFFFYFVILPYFWDGKTLGKFIMRIKLVNLEQKLRLSIILTRELFITFLPWFIVLLTNLTMNLIFDVNLSNLFRTNQENSVAIIVMRAVTTVYFFWYLGLIFGTIINPNHQILFDRHFHLFIIKLKPVEVKKKKLAKKPISRSETHIHLKKDQPGNISDEILKEIDDL